MQPDLEPSDGGPLGSPDDPWTDDALTGDYRVFQRKRGHRYSLDDLLTAVTAGEAAPSARRHVDLGCGLGSVLLSVAWMLRENDAMHVGVEAQDVSFELARRNVARNGLQSRIVLQHGDLRDFGREPSHAHAFDLVTGTPPYVPPGRSTPAPDPQKAYARIEYRGGVEAYLEAAGRLVTAEGTVVVCGDARSPERLEMGARDAGLFVHGWLDAVPREGAEALFSVVTLRRTPAERVRIRFVARDAAGLRSPAYLALRARLGLPANYDPHASTPEDSP